MKTKLHRLATVAVTAGLAVGLTWGAPVEAGKADDTLNWSTNREIAVVDPYYNNTRELVIMGHMGWDGLVLRDLDSGEIKPLLATSWAWAGDTAIELELRDDVVFHDGSAFDADDVVYTLNHVSNKDNGVLTFRNVSWIKNAEKLASHKVRINLHKPFPPAFAYLSNAVFILPSGHYDNAPILAEGKPDYGAVKPVGTGPYKVTDVKAGEYVLMEKNENYFSGSTKGKPQIGKMRFRTLTEMNTQIAELMTGGLDWIWDVPKDQAERMESAPTVTIENAKTFRVSYMAFDVDGDSGTDVFTNKKVRQAVSHAINRESIAKNLVGPASEVIHSACHPDQFGCDQNVTKYDYDPAKAKSLLAEAGYPDGFEFDIYAYRQREFTEAVIGDLAKVGVKANLHFMQYRALRDIVRRGETPINHMTWGSYSIPDVSAIVSHFFTHGPEDPAKDPKTKELLDVADNSVEPDTRKLYYTQAFERIASEAYWLPMFTYAKYYAFSKDLNFKATSDEIPRFYTATWN
ncbi:ABC transporter substrate-binding protein [Pelagibius sp. Alg239-R121]|uniref:ABC transporter substrate-binding protein n=1 Tax=Pelagibius sp. Alg239-R121 TaxID=2993448 RepID=UPI0024A73069|nr:ABC transporter substrate-binding protein [Pelagibius sp. Alg239-R121]